MVEPSVTLAVRVTPRADRNSVSGVRGDGVVLETLANALKLKKSQLTLAGGETSRDKRIKICGLSAAEVQSRLES